MNNPQGWSSASENMTGPLPLKRLPHKTPRSSNKAGADKGTDIWLLTLSDLLMLLVICFVILFGMGL